MLLAGDEFGRTQGGNNNAYCQDSEISWLHWDLEEKGSDLVDFTRKLTALRHKYPILRHGLFLSGDYNEATQTKDLTWIAATGDEMGPEEWDDANTRCIGMLIDGHAQTTGIKRRGADATVLIVFNGWQDLVGFTLPEAPEGTGWALHIDTNQPDLSGEPAFAPGDRYDVTARSVLMFVMGRE